jgi:hypothetical protein
LRKRRTLPYIRREPYPPHNVNNIQTSQLPRSTVIAVVVATTVAQIASVMAYAVLSLIAALGVLALILCSAARRLGRVPA